MKFTALQENLRKTLLQRIQSGELTGRHLAQQSRFEEAHISNFLNRKRGLSLKGMDKVLSVQHLSVLDLLDPLEINRRAFILPTSDDEFDNVLLTSSSVAATCPLINADQILDIFKLKRSFLRQIKPQADGNRSNWHRFVLIRLEARDAIPMSPRLGGGAMLLIDRHYNSLKPYREGDFNLYAVLKNDTCAVRYVEIVGNQLLLRPHNCLSPIEVIPVADGKNPDDYLVGRVCHIALEI